MKLTNPDLLIKPSEKSSAFATKPPFPGGTGGGYEFNSTTGKRFSLYCKRNRHEMCRFEACDCECHDKKKAEAQAAARAKQTEHKPVAERSLIPVPWISIYCGYEQHKNCIHVDCECHCHDNERAYFNPAFRHEMSR